MFNISLLQLFADAGLITSLVFLSYHILRGSGLSPDAGRARAMEAKLRNLLREAEQSGAEFRRSTDEKQRVLEELLFDIRTVEGRINDAIERAEGLKREISAPSSERFAGSAEEPRESERVGRREQSPYAQVQERVPEPASFGSARSSNPYAQQQAPAQTSAVKPAAVNIFGEPIETSAAPAPERAAAQAQDEQGPIIHRQQEEAPAPSRRAQERRLAEQIEREVLSAGPAKSKASSGNSLEQLEDVYEAAERLFQSGKDLEYVAAKTKLPLEELRMLSQIVRNKEQEASGEASRSDERLGVLGAGSGIQRESRVL